MTRPTVSGPETRVVSCCPSRGSYGFGTLDGEGGNREEVSHRMDRCGRLSVRRTVRRKPTEKTVFAVDESDGPCVESWTEFINNLPVALLT